ncbi:paired mesoderm homeobox protein 1b [Etheostoma cragini]|uniref:paired mesoderm homeobox protein 1b n=1 Tax=Etheostoma cragini TaxID=417921 RepID=UPI00155F275D|nr:paired mesoderm homeobox protein 1b [Etheostoma cragini]
MTSSYAHVMDRQASIANRLESPITSNLDTLQAKKNFSVSHLLDLEEAGEMVGTQADESIGEAGRSLLESPGLTSGSDTTQQENTFLVCKDIENARQPPRSRHVAATQPPRSRHAAATQPPRSRHVAATQPPRSRHADATQPPSSRHAATTQTPRS